MTVDAEISPLSRGQRWIVLAVAFSGWMFAGMEISIMPLICRPAMRSFLATAQDSLGSPLSVERVEALVGTWLSYYITVFLLGAALGGLLFGWLGDRVGRAKGMALSILCYSLFTAVSYFSRSPEELLFLRLIACLGVGGMWPNGVSLVSEVWTDASRPFLAGLIGTAANVGFVILGVIGYFNDITPDSWRWVLLLGGVPAALGVFALVAVPESPSWLARKPMTSSARGPSPVAEILRPPLLKLTILGILLGAIPLVGTSSAANWMVSWADKAGGAVDPQLKALTQIARSSGAAFGSLIGGWLANLFGRRITYFGISLASLLSAGYIYQFLTPTDPSFQLWTFIFGFVGVAYFGWLPLYLPELFPTRVRSTGTGVSFNFGRIVAIPTVIGAGWLMILFEGDYAKVGSITSLIYLLGMVIIWWAPDTAGRKLEEI